MTSKKSGNTDALWKRVSELGGASAFLLYLAEAASSHLTVNQAAFFMLAATADAQGKPKTRSQILEMAGSQLSASIRNTYRQLLPPDRVRPDSLGWLEFEPNADDYREKFLRVTAKGKSVVSASLGAMAPLERV